MKIKVIGLSGCRKCSELRKGLEKFKVSYVFSDCEENPENCDSLEAATNTKQYPMVLLSDGNETLIEILYVTERYETLIKGSYSQNGVRFIPLYSTDSVLRYALSRLNLTI
jgi:glutaredoxin